MLRKIIKIDEDKCDGCGLCIPSCKEGALQIIDGKVSLVSDIYCDGLGSCLGECPKGALTIEEREADEFNEAAVEEHLKLQTAQNEESPLPCGCPGSMTRSFEPRPSQEEPTHSRQTSELRQWPIQLHLLNPSAPYLKGADVVLMADCTAFAYANAHSDFIRGRRIAIACPKLDDTSSYVPKLAGIIKGNGIRSLEVVVMEVPCCQGLAAMAEDAIRQAGSSLKLKKTTIGIEGDIVEN